MMTTENDSRIPLETNLDDSLEAIRRSADCNQGNYVNFINGLEAGNALKSETPLPLYEERISNNLEEWTPLVTTSNSSSRMVDEEPKYAQVRMANKRPQTLPK